MCERLFTVHYIILFGTTSVFFSFDLISVTIPLFAPASAAFHKRSSASTCWVCRRLLRGAGVREFASIGIIR